MKRFWGRVLGFLYIQYMLTLSSFYILPSLSRVPPPPLLDAMNLFKDGINVVPQEPQKSLIWYGSVYAPFTFAVRNPQNDEN